MLLMISFQVFGFSVVFRDDNICTSQSLRLKLYGYAA